MAAEMEDATTFLEGLSALCSDISSMLTKTQLLALDVDPRVPYEDSNVRDHESAKECS